MSKFLTRFAQDESGATAIEYGLIAALISITIIAAAQSIGSGVKTRFEKVNNCMAASTSAAAQTLGC
jgi:pilus assembly protein Flp/PilA